MDKEFKEAFQELKGDIKKVNINLQDAKTEQASFKAEVLANLKHGHERFAKIKADTEEMRGVLQEIQMNNVEHEVRIGNSEKEISGLKNNKLKDRILALGSGGGGGGIITAIFKLFGGE